MVSEEASKILDDPEETVIFFSLLSGIWKSQFRLIKTLLVEQLIFGTKSHDVKISESKLVNSMIFFQMGDFLIHESRDYF